MFAPVVTAQATPPGMCPPSSCAQTGGCSPPVTGLRARPPITRPRLPPIFAYCGPFHADDDSQTVIHSAEVSLFPNWTGQVLRRHVMIDKDILRLSTVGPYVSGGKRVHACMTWNRAETS
jgi:hypothetical protein